MRLIELMFCNPLSDTSELLMRITELLSDLQEWPELTEPEKADLFGKLIGAKQSIDHCLRVNFKADPESTPKRLEDVIGAEKLAPWSLPDSRPPVVDGRFLDCVDQLLKEGVK